MRAARRMMSLSGVQLRRFALAVSPAKAGFAAVLACSALLPAMQPVAAHEAPGSWTYPKACCHGDAETGECQRIPGRSVHVRPGGWVVLLKPGDHRRITRQQRYFVPTGDELPSHDGDYHICIHPTEEDANCFFVPPDTM